MSGDEVADQPLTGFGYDYWFTCTGCNGRVRIEADRYELQCTGQAEFTACTACGVTVDITQQSLTLRDPDDPAARTDSIDRLVWYHSSRYENWPDRDAYAADIAAIARQTVEKGRGAGFFDPDRFIAGKLALAVHLGTYEATIENILRRLMNQDHTTIFDTRYWLHRVEISLNPGELYPGVNDEFSTMFGDVELEQLAALGARAVRYINRHEAKGSVSVAIDPALVHSVTTIELPVVEATLPETAAATAATERMVEAAKAGDDNYEAWAMFAEELESEYLSGVNPQVREPFSRAIGKGVDPVEYHRRFRIQAGLLMRPDIVNSQFASAHRRQIIDG